MRNFPPSRIFINWNIFECPKTSMLYVMAWLTFWNECLYLVEASFVFCKIQNTNFQEWCGHVPALSWSPKIEMHSLKLCERPKSCLLHVMACLTFWNECSYLVEASFVLFKIQNTNFQECSLNWKPCNFLKTYRIERRNGWYVADNRAYKQCWLVSVKMLLEW